MDCPYPNHGTSKIVQEKTDGFYFCSDSVSCNRSSFRCNLNKCDGINRTYARFCVKCGSEIDFNKSIGLFANLLKIDNDFAPKISLALNFDNLSISDIRQMLHHFGFLIINAGEQGLITLNAFNLTTDAIYRTKIDNKVLNIAKINDTDGKLSNSLLITTDKCVYKLTITDEIGYVPLLQKLSANENEGILKPARILSDNSIILFIKKANGETALRQYKDFFLVNEVHLPAVEISIPIILKDESLFFFSLDNFYFYQTNKTLLNYPIKNNVRFNFYNYSRLINDDIFIAGDQTPYRLSYLNDPTTPIPVLVQPIGAYRMSFSPDGFSMFLTHNQGFTIVNPLSGGVQWDMKTDPIIGLNIPALQFPAQDIGNYYLITTQGLRGSVIRFIPKTKDDIFVSKAFDEILCEPLVVLNTLIVAAKEKNESKLEVMQLCGT